MTALAGAVLIASLLGSVHCAGMCGAFVAFAVAGDHDTNAPRAALHAAYNLGRLLTYASLGAAAGLVGAGLDLGGSLIGLQRTAAVLAGAMMIGIALVSILRSSGVRIRRLPLPGVFQRLALAGHRAAAGLPPIHRAAATGLLTTLLPCGWLYAFVITAAGTASPLWGGVTMAVFWVGTLPILIGIGIGVQALTGRLRRHLPLMTSLLIMAVGLWTIAGRWSIVGLSPQNPGSDRPAIQRVRSLEASSTCPLCE